ncbi:MAG TPA: hypothetical protein DIV86_05025 [Alphaproteobacteria bacterium]|nr:hypothetical protein [Alphaproteobacteria bacterium]
MIKITFEKTFWGASIYAATSVVLLKVSAENDNHHILADHAVSMGKAFTDLLPLSEQRKGETTLQYVSRFLAEWSFAVLNKHGYIHSVGSTTKSNKIFIWLGFHNPKVSVNCILLGKELLLGIASGQISSEEAVKRAKSFIEKTRAFSPDYQAKILMQAAFLRNIPYMNFSLPDRHWQYGWGSKSKIYFDSISEKDSAIGRWIVGDKHVNKAFMRKLGVPIVNHLLISNLTDLQKVISTVGFPCVIKPLDLGQAKGVTVNILNEDELKLAFSKARKISKSPIMVESYIEGDVHRLLVIGGKLIAASRRSPASVFGDGVSSVIKLAEEFNKKRMANAQNGDGIGPAPYDSEFDLVISKQGFSRSSIPKKGHKVKLRSIPLQGSGADNSDVTDIVHHDTKFMVESLAKSVGLNIVGYDFITEDVSVSCHKKGAFIEMNSCPSLRGHIQNGIDVRDVANHALGYEIGRIPSVMIIADDLSYHQYKPELALLPSLGWRFSDGVGIGGCLFKKIELSHPIEASVSLISNKSVEKILLVCSLDEIIKFGIPLDMVDHLIITKKIDSDWRDVLYKHSKTQTEMYDKINMADVIKKHLL